MATGLLPICFGEATKFSSDLLNADKVYDAVIALGTVTTTGDAEGTVVRRAAVQVSRKQVEAALARFRGSIEQVPPMHSALKHQGRPLYAYAREGTEIVRAPRAVTIVRLDLVEFGGDLVHVEVACSKGTYIRTLAADVGDALSCGGHLARLRRLRVGPLDLSAATTLEALEQLDPVSRDALLQPVDSLVQTLPAVVLEAESARRFASGQVLRVPGCGATGEVRVYAAGRFVGVGTVEPEGTLAPRRLISTQVPPAAAIAPANQRGIA
jgi:tRNA pseudouridine55 synthase